MPDITMCKGEDCIQKHACFRHTAVPDSYSQSYFEKPPREKEEVGIGVYMCEYFLKNEV